MLLDTSGNVVYTAYKGADLGVNLLSGPYNDSAFEEAFRNVLRTNAVNAVTFTDFEPYAPSYNVPTAFGFCPYRGRRQDTGVLVLQLPVEGINNVMTTNQQWAQTVLGRPARHFWSARTRLSARPLGC